MHKTPVLQGVSFSLKQGSIAGIVGESGCGKSTLARIVCILEKPDRGEIIFEGTNLLNLRPGDLKKARIGFQIIFQDSFSSMNPRMKIEDIIGEPLKNYNEQVQGILGRDKRTVIIDALQKVGLGKEMLKRYPHQLSGGQCQRVNIARAVVIRPKLLICDEPTSSLDVSAQAQILNLLVDLRKELGLSIIFISHNLAVIRYVCDRVMVMQNGIILEELETEDLPSGAAHPYTKLLLSSV